LTTIVPDFWKFLVITPEFRTWILLKLKVGSSFEPRKSIRFYSCSLFWNRYGNNV